MIFYTCFRSEPYSRYYQRYTWTFRQVKLEHGLSWIEEISWSLFFNSVFYSLLAPWTYSDGISRSSKMSVSNIALSMLQVDKLVELILNWWRYEFANLQFHLRVKSLALKLFAIIYSNFSFPYYELFKWAETTFFAKSKKKG